jgi:hypothetical protein
MRQSPYDKLLVILQRALLVLLAVLLLLKSYSSLHWRMEHDTPLLQYAAFLMDTHGRIPYRDIFETSMPGTFAFHYVIGKLFGYGDDAFRYVDLTLLGALLIVAYKFMNRFGRQTGILAAMLFGLVYLSQGQTMSLQRDYIGIIPVAFAILCIPARMNIQIRLERFALVGFLFGMSILIKPHLGIALPFVFAALLAFRWNKQKKSGHDFIKCAAVAGAALLAPLCIAMAWLAADSALEAFTDIVINYLPLHSAMTGGQRTIFGLDRALYLIWGTSILGGFGFLVLLSMLAYYHVALQAGKDEATQISLASLALCTLAYAVYPVFAGKFWPYHYMPLVFFCSLSAGLCLYESKTQQPIVLLRVQKTILLAALAVTVSVQLPLYDFVSYLDFDLHAGREAHAPKNGRVDEIADWLKNNLRPSDTVQPLDWSGGSIHAMLLAKADLATRFMYDYHFYHHVSSPYIQGLRRTFISQLRDAPPRFIIAVYTNKPWVTGADTTNEFPELSQFLYSCYRMAHQGDGYSILERTPGCTKP